MSQPLAQLQEAIRHRLACLSPAKRQLLVSYLHAQFPSACLEPLDAVLEVPDVSLHIAVLRHLELLEGSVPPSPRALSSLASPSSESQLGSILKRDIELQVCDLYPLICVWRTALDLQVDQETRRSNSLAQLLTALARFCAGHNCIHFKLQRSHVTHTQGHLGECQPLLLPPNHWASQSHNRNWRPARVFCWRLHSVTPPPDCARVCSSTYRNGNPLAKESGKDRCLEGTVVPHKGVGARARA